MGMGILARLVALAVSLSDGEKAPRRYPATRIQYRAARISRFENRCSPVPLHPKRYSRRLITCPDLGKDP